MSFPEHQLEGILKFTMMEKEKSAICGQLRQAINEQGCGLWNHYVPKQVHATGESQHLSEKPICGFL